MDDLKRIAEFFQTDINHLVLECMPQGRTTKKMLTETAVFYEKLLFQIAKTALNSNELATLAIRKTMLKAGENISQWMDEADFLPWFLPVLTETCNILLQENVQICFERRGRNDFYVMPKQFHKAITDAFHSDSKKEKVLGAMIGIIIVVCCAIMVAVQTNPNQAPVGSITERTSTQDINTEVIFFNRNDHVDKKYINLLNLYKNLKNESEVYVLLNKVILL